MKVDTDRGQMKIKCVDNCGCSYLTVGKVYPVVSSGYGLLTIISDNGERSKASLLHVIHGKFEVVEE